MTNQKNKKGCNQMFNVQTKQINYSPKLTEYYLDSSLLSDFSELGASGIFGI